MAQYKQKRKFLTPKNLTRKISPMTVKPVPYPPIVWHESRDEENDSEGSEGSDVTLSDCNLEEEDMELEEESDSEDKRDLQEVSRCKVLTLTID